MNPAYSVIFFSTASGAGYGLLIALVLAGSAGLAPADRWFGATALTLAFALVTGGLLSSTFHLGHPERAWRAFSQWRTSWLSREGVAAVLTYVPAGVYALGWIAAGRGGGAWEWSGLLAALLAAGTVVCTAMIYASLRPVPRWRNVWVVPVFVTLAAATGALLLSFLLHAFGTAAGWMAWTGAALTALAWACKLAYWRSVDRPRRDASTAESATGLTALGEVRLLEGPHTADNYVMKEMGFQIARRHARRLRTIAVGAGALVPVLSSAAAAFAPRGPATLLALLAVAGAAVGVLVERWLFFAEARHVVTLYYGERSA